MTGFHNVTEGIKHFLEKFGHEIDDEVKQAIALLAPSIHAVAEEIRLHGPDVVKAAAIAAAAAISAAKAEGKSNSDAGHSALSAAETAAGAAAVTLTMNALHAITTAQVTGNNYGDDASALPPAL